MAEPDNFFISTDKSLLDINVIFNFLSSSYWANGRSIHTIKQSIENSLCFGVYLNKKQIGFARVITDYSTFGYIADVFILEEHRGNGYSKELIKAIKECSELQNIRRWMLATKDAHGLYAKFGFQQLKNPERFMEIVNPYSPTAN
ncbi:MAG TPA: GNAT family N-acetyltransferase [Ignavibacteriaceae bacterium]|nr:GNAT family N-acetyltransferase [Ignavibacteriaceae bacterium]